MSTYKLTGLVVALGAVQIASTSGLAAGKTRFSAFAADGSLVHTQDVDGLTLPDVTGLATKPVTATAIRLDTAGNTLFDAVNCTLTDLDAGSSAPAPGTDPVMVTPLASLSGSVATE